MTVKQKNLRVFYIQIDDIKEFLEYYAKNKIILKEFFLLISGEENAEIVNTLNKDNVCFKYIDGYNIRLGNVKKDIPSQESKPQIVEKKLFEEKETKQTLSVKVYDRPIRSGEEINEDVPVSVFGRINSGAKLFNSQATSIYGEIDGLVQCDGEYLILLGITPRGHVIFNGEIIDRDMLKQNVLQKITMKNAKLIIKEII